MTAQSAYTETETDIHLMDDQTAIAEAALVLKVVEERDLIAFDLLYDRYFSRVYNYVRYRVSDSVITDDLTSQVFVGMLRGLSRYDSARAPFGAWLFGLARRVVSDHYRRQGREHQPHISLETMGDHTDEITPPEEQTITSERHQQLLTAVARLTERERDLIALKFGAGLTHRQIAEATGLSEGNVGVVLHRALKQLRALLPQE